MRGNADHQAGRTCQKPLQFSSSSPAYGGELLRMDVWRLFKQCKAPAHWGEREVWFFIHTASYPEHFTPNGCLDWIVGAATLRSVGPSVDLPLWTPDAVMFTHLYASSPDVFLAILSGLRKRIKARRQSPVFKVAQWLLTQHRMGKEWVWNEKAESICQRAKNVLHWSVTPKVVEHARARIRKAQGWQF